MKGVGGCALMLLCISNYGFPPILYFSSRLFEVVQRNHEVTLECTSLLICLLSRRHTRVEFERSFAQRIIDHVCLVRSHEYLFID
jgi:hypothetical protein